MAGFAFRPTTTYTPDVNPLLATTNQSRRTSLGSGGAIGERGLQEAKQGQVGRTEVKLVISNNAIENQARSASQVSTALSTLLRSIHNLLNPSSDPLKAYPTAPEKLSKLCTALFTTPTCTSAGSDAGFESAGRTLFARLKTELERKAATLQRELLSALPNGGEEEEAGEKGLVWLDLVKRKWEEYGKSVRTVRAVFVALDRLYILPVLRKGGKGASQDLEYMSLSDLANRIFAASLLGSATSAERLVSVLIAQIRAYRTKSLSVDFSAAKDLPPAPSALISVLSIIRLLYPHVPSFTFDNTHSAASSVFYSALSQALLNEAPWKDASPIAGCTHKDGLMAKYVATVARSLAVEKEVVKIVYGFGKPQGGPTRKVDEGSEEKVKEAEKVVAEEMIVKEVGQVIDKGLVTLLKPEYLNSLSKLYKITSSQAPHIVSRILDAYTKWLRDAGLALVSDKAQDDQMIDRLLDFRKFTDNVAAKAFSSGGPEDKAKADFAARKAFEWFVNQRENKPAEMIAKFLDAKLKSGAKGADDDKFEQLLAGVLTLLRFAQGKDMFEAFYKRDLAKRLLLGKSASTDVERSMLLKLREVCGPDFTQQLETMFKDIDISNDVMAAYKLYRQRLSPSTSTKGSGEIDLQATVLTTGNWPTFPQTKTVLPPVMAKRIEDFNSFYSAKYTGRSLSWLYGLHHCTIKAAFPSGKKELLVSLFQALCLLLFSGSGGASDGGERRLTYEDIKTQTGLDDKELKRTLQSLACGKVRVLTKTPRGREVDSSDEFTVNSKFEHENFRVRINQVQSRETVDENKSTTSRVFLDREALLQVHIVRIMKGKKTMTHNELVHEVVGVVKDRFKVEIAEIKKAIDSLIDREYLERQAGTRSTYNYLA